MTAAEWSPDRLAAARAANQLLHRPRGLSHPADVAKAICGTQAQDMRHGILAFRARHATLTAADVEQARGEERALVRVWAMRNTLHLIAAEDVPWLLPLFEPMLETFARRRLTEVGLDADAQEKALRHVARMLDRDSPLARTEVRSRLEAKGYPMKGYAGGHMIGLAVATGIAVEGPDEGRVVPSLVRAEDWLGPRPKQDREKALGELALRYFRAFGPATEQDFAKWTGLPLRELRLGIARAGRALRETSLDGRTGWAGKGATRRPRSPVVRLIPAWETYVMGYRDRSFMAGSRWKQIAGLTGGMLAPVIVVDGRVIGTWRPTRQDEPVAAEVRPFRRPDARIRAAIEAEIKDVGRFEGR